MTDPRVIRNCNTTYLAKRVLGIGGLFASGLVAYGLVGSPSVSAQSLQNALAMAYATNPSLEAERARLYASDEAIPRARAGLLPQVRVNANVNAQKRLSDRRFFSTSPNDIVTTPITAQISVTQNIYTGGRVTAALRDAEYRVQQTRAELRLTEQNVLRASVEAYMDVVRNRAILQLRENSESVLRRQLDATRDRFAVGETTRTDVAQAESRVSAARAQAVLARGNLASSNSVYTALIGTPPGSSQSAPDPLPPTPPSLNTARGIALASHPSLIAVRFGLLASEEQINTAFGQLLPNLAMVGQYSASYNTQGQSSHAGNLSLGAQLSIPLYQGGGGWAGVRVARQNRSRAQLAVAAAERSVLQEVTSSWEAQSAARAAVGAFRDEVRAQSIAYDGVRQESLVGSRTVLEVLDAEQELLNAQVNLVRAQRDSVVATFRLLAAIGKLTAVDLGLPVRMFNPNTHYRRVRDQLFGLE